MAKKKAVAPKKTEPEVTAFEVTDSVTDVEIKDIENVPDPCDPRWTEFIINQLQDQEKFNDLPKADGLRRMVEVHIGPILGLETELKSWPHSGDNNNLNTATAATRLTIGDRRLGQEVVVTAVADANEQSCPPPFSKFLSSIAETRAEGRAYRKALRLQNIVTSDEMPMGEDHSFDKISSQQIDLIDKMCNNLDLNVQNIMFRGTKSEKPKIRSYSKQQGIDVLAGLHDVQNGKIPTEKLSDESKGYDKQWREYFGG